MQKEEIRLLNIRLYGYKGEKLSPDQTALLFGEASVSVGEVVKEAQLSQEDRRSSQSQTGSFEQPGTRRPA